MLGYRGSTEHTFSVNCEGFRSDDFPFKDVLSFTEYSIGLKRADKTWSLLGQSDRGGGVERIT